MFQIPGIRQHRLGFLATLGLLVFAAQTSSQSGRRTKPSSPTSIPPVKVEDSTKRTVGRQLTEPVHLIVGNEFTSRRMLSEESILANFIRRLNEFKNVSAINAGDLSRDLARKQAKKETGAIVLLIQFDIDSFQKGTYFPDSPDLDVRVVAFAPRTGREKFKGKVYYKALQGPMVKRDNWPGGTPIKITSEAVGVEAADQVHDWLLLEELRRRRP